MQCSPRKPPTPGTSQRISTPRICLPLLAPAPSHATLWLASPSAKFCPFQLLSPNPKAGKASPSPAKQPVETQHCQGGTGGAAGETSELLPLNRRSLPPRYLALPAGMQQHPEGDSWPHGRMWEGD